MTIKEKKYSQRAYTKQAVRAHRARKKAAIAKAPPVPDIPLVEWIESTLIVPSGPLAGKPFRLGQWQRDFLAGALADGIRESGLSVARKNGKSGLIAALLLAFTVGCLRRPSWRCVVTSLTGKLSAELRDAIEATAKASGLQDAITVRRSPSPGHILGPDGTRIDFLAADRATGHGVGADIALIDEAGLIQENGRPLWNAMLSSVSGRDGRMISISIQGDGPMFRELQERADAKTIYWQEHSAGPDAALDDRAIWAAANPGLQDGIKSLSYMEDMAARAAAIPADQASFRLYDLNTPGAGLHTTIVGLSDWQACLVDRLPAADGPCCVGVDLGGSSSMTAAACYWPFTGRLEVWGAFAGIPNLLARGKSDGVNNRYEQMESRRELTVYEGLRSTPVAPFLKEIISRLDGADVVKVLADRYRQSEFLDVLAEVDARWPLEVRGTAVSHGNEDTIAFQRAVIDGRIRAKESLLMASAITESRIGRDRWGNVHLDKRRAESRIDPLQAAVLAVSAGSRLREKKVERRLYVV